MIDGTWEYDWDESKTVEVQGRLWCYVELPDDMEFVKNQDQDSTRDGTQYDGWTTVMQNKYAAWSSEPKWFTSNSNSKFMLKKQRRNPQDISSLADENVQDFYYQKWVSQPESQPTPQPNDPVFGLAAVIDTSGSMWRDPDNTSDKWVSNESGLGRGIRNAYRAITAALLYPRLSDTKDIQLWMFTGTYSSNLELTAFVDQQFKKTDSQPGNNEGEQLLNLILSKTKSDIPGKGSHNSESMMSCLYATMNSVFNNKTLTDKSLFRFKSTATSLRSINFLLLTDESILSIGCDNSTGTSNSGGDSGSYYYLTRDTKTKWLRRWQSNGENISSPLYVPSIDEKTMLDKKNHAILPPMMYQYESYHYTFGHVNLITLAFEQLSYYYGINFTWAMSKLMVDKAGEYYTSNGDYDVLGKDKTIMVNTTTYPSAVTWLKKYTRSGDIPTTSQPWYVPSGCHKPLDIMCMVHFRMPQGVKIKDNYVLTTEDQYKLGTEAIKKRFHQVYHPSSGRYDYYIFRYFGEKITLPKASQMEEANQITVDPGTGLTPVTIDFSNYKWETTEGSSQKKYALGKTNYELKKANAPASADYTQKFELKEQS